MDPFVLLRRVGFEQGDWTVDDLAHNKWLTPGIWLLRRSARKGHEQLVLKWLSATRPAGNTAWEAHWSLRDDEPTRWNYWAREALAYQSDVLAKTFGGVDGFVTPKCVGLDVTDMDAVVLLEFVDGVAAEHWTIDQYGEAAFALGVVQARVTPCEEPWLSRGFLRDYSTEKPVNWDLLDADSAWEQPLIKECFRPELRALAIEVHHRRDDLYAMLSRAPQVPCHLDFWTKNLIRTTTGQIALIDWAFVGQGALGEDIGNLIPDAAFDHFIRADQLLDLETAVLASYLRGLWSSGWDGDADVIRRNVWASAVKYDWLTPLLLERALRTTHLRYGGQDKVDAHFLYQERGLALEFALGRALQALG